MFDVGFWELSLIAVVALLVVGPERLPKLARTVGLWVGKARSFVSTVKADIDKELRADELREIIDEQAKLTELQDIADETSRVMHDTKRAADETSAADTAAREPSVTAPPPSTPASAESKPDVAAVDTPPPVPPQTSADAEPRPEVAAVDTPSTASDAAPSPDPKAS